MTFRNALRNTWLVLAIAAAFQTACSRASEFPGLTLVADDWVPYRVVLIGNFGTDLALKRDINRYMVSEDPYGTLDFVEFGIQRGEVRDDVDLYTVVSLVDWLSGSIQDALVTEELDPGLFHRFSGQPERQKMRVEQFTILLKSAIGATAPPAS